MQKRFAFSFTFTDDQIAKLCEICRAKPDFKATNVAYASFSCKLVASCVVVNVFPQRNQVVFAGKGAPEFIEFEVEPKITGACGGLPAEMFELHAGLDESGKGDLFGPVVTACVVAGGNTLREWLDYGVRDSKKVADKKIFALDKMIRATPGAFVKTAWTHDYNKAYAHCGNNLNKMLASVHAASLGGALEAAVAAGAVPAWGLLDQFSVSPTLRRQIESAGADAGIENFELKMRPRAEDDIAVAAASIVARAFFLRKIAALSKKARVKLPLSSGAEAKAAAVEVFRKNGEARFGEFVKLNFKTAAEAAAIAQRGA